MNEVFASLKMWRRLLHPFLALTLLATSVLAGCGREHGKSTVIMQNPETMEFVNCKMDSWAFSSLDDKKIQCVEDMKKQGYVVWGEY